MSSIRAWLIAFACLGLPALASAACYQLFDGKNKLVLQSSTAPVDTSKSLTEEVARLFPGHFLIVGGDGPCQEVDELRRDDKAAFKPPADALIRESVVIPSGYDDIPYTLPSRSYGVGSYSGSYRSPPGADVHVRSYRRGDGTVVQSHTRGRPGSGSKR